MDDEYCKGYENQNLSYNVNKISGKEQLNKLYLLIYEINIFRLQSELLSISHPINLSLKKKKTENKSCLLFFKSRITKVQYFVTKKQLAPVEFEIAYKIFKLVLWSMNSVSLFL